MTEPLLPTPRVSDQKGGKLDRAKGRLQMREMVRLLNGEPTSACSLGSEDSTSPSTEPDTDASAKSNGTSPADESSSDGGPTFPDGGMSPGSPLLPTPAAGLHNYDESPETWDVRREQIKTRGINGNGMGEPLGITVQRLTSSAGDSPASPPPSPVAARDQRTRGGYGASSPESLGSCDREWFYSRTYLDFAAWKENGMPPLTAAYVAGLIDGEGCVAIRAAKAARSTTWHARIDVAMTDKALPLLKMLHQQYGGQLRKTRDATEKWGEAWAWRLLEREPVKGLLMEMLPHLVIKQEQAALALRLIALMEALPADKRGHARWTPEARADAQTMFALMKELNLKGPTVMQQAGWFARYVGGQWLTDQGSLLEPTGLARFSGTWPASGMTRRGRAYALPMSVRATDASGSSWLQTPRHEGFDAGNHRGQPDSLNQTVRQLPTPTTRDHKGRNQRDDESCLTGALGSLGDHTNQPSDDGNE